MWKEKFHKWIPFAIALVLLAAGGVLTALSLQREEDVVYKETEVKRGSLTVGITEEGSVVVEGSTQELTLDISAYTGNSSMVWGIEMPVNIWGQEESQTKKRELEVEEVYVSVGEQVEKGAPLYRLTTESVETIREELEADKTAAALALQQAETGKKQETLLASQEYESNVIYGEVAEIEYNETMEAVTKAYTESQKQIETLTEELLDLQENKTVLEEQLKEDTHLYEEIAYRVTYIDKEEDPYGYITNLQLSETMLDTKEKRAEDLEKIMEEIEQKQETIETAEEALKKCERERRIGEVEAVTVMENRTFNYKNAQNLYYVKTALLETKWEEAEDAYEQAAQKLNQFDASISSYNLLSEYDGVVTEVMAKKGDILAKGSRLVTVNNYALAEVTVSVTEQEVKEIEDGEMVNIYLPAFAENNYTGKVTEIGVAEINSSSSEITYPVTVQIMGDVKGIYQDMSGEVTFVTKESKEVIYVSNRAVVREGTKSYVLVRQEGGGRVKKEVLTGFSDGINVEIIEGLSEGDVLLIESKVNSE